MFHILDTAVTYCKTPSLGALILFCAWFNFIVLLKNAPIIGATVNLLFHICWKYIALIYLPILLIISFALPFYMLFVNGTVSSTTCIPPHICKIILQSSITGFDTSRWSLLTTFAATPGGLGYSDIFLNGPRPYLPASIVLFMIFVVIVSILFNNMLVCDLDYLVSVINSGCSRLVLQLVMPVMHFKKQIYLTFLVR